MEILDEDFDEKIEKEISNEVFTILCSKKKLVLFYTNQQQEIYGSTINHEDYRAKVRSIAELPLMN